ncbi:STAS domain-containing protein [candidate division KSB1 bacterium]|nr:STAS domain-containing protein [candidate division KSB1 bacterium]
MDFLLDKVDQVQIVRLKVDRLDTNIAPDLKAQLLVLLQKDAKLMIDLSNVNYADSSGLGALLLGVRLARENQARFVVINATKRVKSLLQIAQLENVIQNFEDEADALAAINE